MEAAESSRYALPVSASLAVEKTMSESESTIGALNIKIDTSDLDVATEKAERLKSLLADIGDLQSGGSPAALDQWAYDEIVNTIRALAVRLERPVTIHVEADGLAVTVSTVSDFQ